MTSLNGSDPVARNLASFPLEPEWRSSDFDTAFALVAGSVLRTEWRRDAGPHSLV